jgi:hypothetical protein
LYRTLCDAGEDMAPDGSLILELGTGLTIHDTGDRLAQFRK